MTGRHSAPRGWKPQRAPQARFTWGGLLVFLIPCIVLTGVSMALPSNSSGENITGLIGGGFFCRAVIYVIQLFQSRRRVGKWSGGADR